MSFLTQFSNYFNISEQQTELYNLWASIGMNAEKALLEEQNKLNVEFTDIGNFSEETLRSWLGFFLKKIPYRSTAKAQVTVKILNRQGTVTGKTEIPQYAQFTTRNGTIYTQMERLEMSGGDERTIIAVQGKRVVETGVYDGLIKVQAKNPDLSYISLTVDGNEIPEVSYQTSYDLLRYMGRWNPNENESEGKFTLKDNDPTQIKGNFYTVIADGKARFSEEQGSEMPFLNGDVVVYDGEKWCRSFESNQINTTNFTSYAIPRDGFYVYYDSNYLYVKIFSGSKIGNLIGKNYVLSYISSDGVQGEIGENTLSYTSTYKDIDENDVTFEIRNKESSKARNEPSVGKLGLYLRERLYCGINISSVPEYHAWFMAQPEVGDCVVMSDYERYIQSGVLESTGIVTVHALGSDGSPLSVSVGEMLLDRIEPFKDIGIIVMESFTEVENYIEVKCTTTTSPELFKQYAVQKVRQYYELDFCQQKGLSLFSDLDLSMVLNDIQNNNPYVTTGLTIKGFHYREYEKESIKSVVRFDGNSYSNEAVGKGKYTVWYKTTESDEIVEVECFEDWSPDGQVTIYRKDDRTNVGSHVGNNVLIYLYKIFPQDEPVDYGVKCYWQVEDDGMLSMGLSDAVRRLPEGNVVVR